MAEPRLKTSWQLDMDSARALAQANHGDPFAVLGPHDTENGRIIRAFLPGAIKVELLRHDDSILAPLEPGEQDGLFENLIAEKGSLSPANSLAQWHPGDRGSILLWRPARRYRLASV